MATKQYKYTHPTPVAATLKGSGDVRMENGGIYELPEDNGFVASLVKQGRLVEQAKPKKVEAAPTTENQPTDK